MQPPQGLPQPQRTWAGINVFCGLIMAVLHGSIANIALPLTARRPRALTARTLWVAHSYQPTVPAPTPTFP